MVEERRGRLQKTKTEKGYKKPPVPARESGISFIPIRQGDIRTMKNGRKILAKHFQVVGKSLMLAMALTVNTTFKSHPSILVHGLLFVHNHCYQTLNFPSISETYNPLACYPIRKPKYRLVGFSPIFIPFIKVSYRYLCFSSSSKRE